MLLDANQLSEFNDNGFLVLPELFNADEIATLNKAMDDVFAERVDADIIEKHSGDVRTAMGLHQRHNVFDKLVRHPRLVEPAQQLRGHDLYIQQVKINVKAAFQGEMWRWHYDFATHHEDDGVPAPSALNLHVFLRDVNEFNGPLYFIRGSHLQTSVPAHHDTTTTSYPLWCVEDDAVKGLIEEDNLFSATGRAGTGLIFADTLVHASPPNLSPWNRPIFSLILNPVGNRQTKCARPEYKHHTDFEPVVSLNDDCLLAG